MEHKCKITKEEKIKVAVIEGVIDDLRPDHKYKSLIVQELKKYQIAEKHLLNIVQICINCTESVIGAYSVKEEAKTKEKGVLGNSGTEIFVIEKKMTSQLTWSASLPIFDPRKKSFEKYLVLLEEAFLLDDLDNERKKMAIVKLKSTEEVRAYIAILPKPITFKVLCERLTANFNSIANKTNVKVQMRHFKIDLEKLHSNILQCMDLVARSTTRVNNELFEYQVECLMDKLSFNKMLFQRMVDSTHRYENIYDIAADIENYHKNMSKMRISNASFSENPERKRSSVTCYRCKKISHIASQCKEENVVKLEDVKLTLNAQSKECKVQNVMHENRVVDSWEPIIYMKDEIREKAMHAAGLQHSEEKIRCGTTLFLP
uniref:CCHC-type domain-containing protein n=1 Tax=Strongyloides papillosus TaxID=174720 RepID=A0A0N5B421_STREA